MIALQQSIIHFDWTIENGAQYVTHFLCSQFSPYPGVTLGRSAWPAVCLLFTLPTLISCYYQEDEGKTFKITAGDEFTTQHTSHHFQSSYPLSTEPIPPISFKDEADFSTSSTSSTSSGELMNLSLNESSKMMITSFIGFSI